MTKRLPVSVPNVVWRNGHVVTQDDLLVEQDANIQRDRATINNFFGSGVLLESPIRKVLFDSNNLTSVQQSLVVSNDFDGKCLLFHNNVTDTVLGTQIQITLSGADVSFRRSLKICVIGIDFENNLMYETFTFTKNDEQVGKKHFKSLFTLLFNDFKGNKNGSRTSGGRVLIREALSLEVSRDPMVIGQNKEPNLFFRDFKLYNWALGPNVSVALYNVLLEGLAAYGYTPDSLDIFIGYRNKKSLADDIQTKLGQKFICNSNNIQKIRLLLGVDRPDPDFGVGVDDYFDWSGELIVSIHELQRSVSCPTDTLPSTAIDYQPNPTPIVQLVVTQTSLLDNGIVLTDVPQPVDFSFVNTRVSNITNSGIVSGNYYVVTIHRAGDASIGTLFTYTGRNLTDDSQYVEYNGSDWVWVDDVEQDLWFEVYSDSLKVASGAAYDAGAGISVDKTEIDEDTGVVLDYCLDNVNFANNGQNSINYVLAQAINEQSDLVQDDQTGNLVFSRNKDTAAISVVTSAGLTSLQQTQEPIILSCVYDTNNRTTATINGTQRYIGLADGNTFHIINPGPELLGYNLVGAKFVANSGNVNALTYVVYKVELCEDGYGDLNGDGYIGADDILRYDNIAAGAPVEGVGISVTSTQAKILLGDYTALELIRADFDGDGVVTSIDRALAYDLYTKKAGVALPNGDKFSRLTLYLENNVGRLDGYHSSYDGWARIWDPAARDAEYGVDPLLTPTNAFINYFGNPKPITVSDDEAAYSIVPFVPVTFQLRLSPVWDANNITTNYTARLLPCSFTDNSGVVIHDCSDDLKYKCVDAEPYFVCDGGKNDFFVPDNLVIGNGEILLRDGNSFPVDFETKIITLKLPSIALENYSLNIFDTFVAESADGFTTKNYPAMRFSDCSFVQANALARNQVRFSVSIESMCQNIEGYSLTDGFGAIIDPGIGTHIDPETGVLIIRATNTTESTDPTLNSKIVITVYLKKAGWKNNNIITTSEETKNLLEATGVGTLYPLVAPGVPELDLTGVKKFIRITVGTSTQACTTTIPSGAVITDVITDITTPYDNSITIDVKLTTSPLTDIQDNTQNDPATVGVYANNPYVYASSDCTAAAYITGVPTVGACYVIIGFISTFLS